MKKLSISSGDAFILVYAVDDPGSLDELEQLRDQILNDREQAYLEATSSSGSIVSTDSALVSAEQTSGTQPPVCKPTAPSSSQPGTTGDHLEQTPQEAGRELSPTRHWSLASLFNHNGQRQAIPSSGPATGVGNLSSLGSSICSSLGSCSFPTASFAASSSSSASSASSALGSPSASVDSSRRSSISAAEAALRTRRTRRPPMVIVANKHDLPPDKHLVNSDEIEALAVIDWDNGFVRASAALNWNVEQIFQQVLRQAKQPPTLAEAIVSKRRKSLPPKLPQSS